MPVSRSLPSAEVSDGVSAKVVGREGVVSKEEVRVVALTYLFSRR